ncbi:MAG: lamin tail domain-containing protein [Candidatus Thalassarchaeaceae archaeon]|nr:lamin tail domain-containing protein [Candidatus Thalassarchaeaceae archaeon]
MAPEGSLRRWRQKSSDEDALTAVIEFLSAFVLFLVIVSAFLALSQLKLGSNVPDSDRLDEMAIDGLERLTDSKGQVVIRENGNRNVSSATENWHFLSASELLNSDYLPAIGDGNGHIDPVRVSALSNVTEDRLIRGLGLKSWMSLNLTITIIDSSEPDRVGVELFADGSARSYANRGSTATRIMHMGAEDVRVTLEVHDGGRNPSKIQITEIMIDPLNGPPEWVELENPDGFAVNLSGWSLSRPGAFTMLGDGALAGGTRAICTGNGDLQYNPNNAMEIDLGSSGVLGSGIIDSLEVSGGTIVLGWTEPGTANTMTIMEFTWDYTWNIATNNSMTYDLNGSPNSVENWTPMDVGTPGW